MHLIASVFVMHNFLIDTRDTIIAIPDKDVLPPEIAGKLEECAAGTRESLEDLGGNEDMGENQAEDAVFQQVPNNSHESTRNALLRHTRWLDNEVG